MGLFRAVNKVYGAESSPRATSENFPAIKTLYQRLRYLWKHNHKVLTKWESEFVLSTGKQLRENKYPLTPRQEQKIRDLLKKFKVSPLDSASTINYEFWEGRGLQHKDKIVANHLYNDGPSEFKALINYGDGNLKYCSYAFDGENLVGFAVLEKIARPWLGVYVLPDYRNQGIAGRLISLIDSHVTHLTKAVEVEPSLIGIVGKISNNLQFRLREI